MTSYDELTLISCKSSKVIRDSCMDTDIPAPLLSTERNRWTHLFACMYMYIVGMIGVMRVQGVIYHTIYSVWSLVWGYSILPISTYLTNCHKEIMWKRTEFGYLLFNASIEVAIRRFYWYERAYFIYPSYTSSHNQWYLIKEGSRRKIHGPILREVFYEPILLDLSWEVWQSINLKHFGPIRHYVKSFQI